MDTPSRALRDLLGAEQYDYVFDEQHLNDVLRVVTDLNRQDVAVDDAKKILASYREPLIALCDEALMREPDRQLKQLRENFAVTLRRCERLYANSGRVHISNNKVQDFVKAIQSGVELLAHLLDHLQDELTGDDVVYGEAFSELLERLGDVYRFSESFAESLASHKFDNYLSQIATCLRSAQVRDIGNGWVKYGHGRSNIRMYGSREGVFARPRIYFLVRNDKKVKARIDKYCASTPVSQVPFERAA